MSWALDLPVGPEASTLLSSSTTSRAPRRVRFQAILAPVHPPPMITNSAERGSWLLIGGSLCSLNFRPWNFSPFQKGAVGRHTGGNGRLAALRCPWSDLQHKRALRRDLDLQFVAAPVWPVRFFFGMQHAHRELLAALQSDPMVQRNHAGART